MADARINALTEATSLDDTDWLVAEVGDSEARKASVATLRTAVSALTLIDSDILGGAGTFDFDSIPGTYSHLLMLLVLRTTANSGATGDMTLNATASAIYHRQKLSGANATAAASAGVAASSALLSDSALVGTTDTAGRASNLRVWLPFYSATTFHKDWLSEAHNSVSAAAGGQYISICCGTFASTSAITRVQIAPSSGSTFVTGSSASLYGLV